MACVDECVGEGDAEAAGGKVGDAADLVDGFVAGAAGDDNFHGAIPGSSRREAAQIFGAG